MKTPLKAESAYIAHFSFCDLADVPLNPRNSLRPVWRTIFSHSRCYEQMTGDFRLPQRPFIRNLGPVDLNCRSSSLGGDRYFADVLDKIGMAAHGMADPCPFGYTETADERFSFIRFELAKPTHVRCLTTKEAGIQTTGKLFLHIYPSGFLTLIFAVAFNWIDSKPLPVVMKLLSKTRPWARDEQWLWSSKFGTHSLPEFFGKIAQCVESSFFSDSSVLPARFAPGFSARKVVIPKAANPTFNELRDVFYGIEEDSVLEIRHSPHTLCAIIGKNGQVTTVHGGRVRLQNWRGHTYEPRYKRDSALAQFWRLALVQEFAHFKMRVYTSYINYISKRILDLRGYRLSRGRKIFQESLLQMSAYDHSILEFIYVLDKQIGRAGPLYRKAYSLVSDGIGFDARREKLNQLLQDWISEVEKWEHPLVSAWRTLISPIRNILS